jgi:hypothetical protein
MIKTFLLRMNVAAPLIGQHPKFTCLICADQQVALLSQSFAR